MGRCSDLRRCVAGLGWEERNPWGCSPVGGSGLEEGLVPFGVLPGRSGGRGQGLLLSGVKFH
jgi:hypothetical protein